MVDFNTIMPTVDQPRKAQQISEASEGAMADERKRVSDAIEKTIRLKAERLAMAPPPVEKAKKAKPRAKAAVKTVAKAPAKPRAKTV